MEKFIAFFGQRPSTRVGKPETVAIFLSPIFKGNGGCVLVEICADLMAMNVHTVNFDVTVVAINLARSLNTRKRPPESASTAEKGRKRT